MRPPSEPSHTMPEAGAWANEYHAPVMAKEVVDVLRGCVDVLDGTLGGGGHALALLESGARVTGIDRDPEAVAASRERLASYHRAGRFRAFTANYADLDHVAELVGVRFNGVLLDLGVSSHQLDDLARGFSFREGAALDMRMEGNDGGSDAASLLQEADERTRAHIVWRARSYGVGSGARSPRATISWTPFAARSVPRRVRVRQYSRGSSRRFASRLTTSLVVSSERCPCFASGSRL